MSKRVTRSTLFLVLFMFIFAQFTVSYAATSSFTPYKVVITANSLNIRQTPSTSGKIVGYYKKGTIVDVVGISWNFLKTNRGYIVSAYTKKYTTSAISLVSRGTSFIPYKAVVSLNYVNIRQGPSTNYKVIGKYYKNNIVDVIGIYGNFLKTKKGYIVNYSVKKVESNVVSTPNTPEKPEVPVVTTPPLYRAKILASILSIRQEASSSSKEVGKYYRGDVVDIFGKEGNFLKTNKGYIYESYTERIQDTSRGNTSSNVGKYLLVNEDTQLLLNTDGTYDERYAVKGKTFKILDEENGYFKIKMGAIYGYISNDKVTVLDYQPKDKLTVAWNYIYAKSSNQSYLKDSNHYINNNSATYGLDVISPTWFYMTGDYKNPSSIKVAEKADREYVIKAHRNGYEVHGLFSEFSADRAYAMFTNSNIRQQVIDDVVKYALTYNLD
ncbi:MAG: SH3 domain-containing protein, partial [Caloramator sp.]|nr:SH3 domain-containing protein [Caloramator sp.]